MKFRNLTLILAVATIYSCSQETVERGETQAINFSTVLTRGTKILGDDGLASAGGFNVWAYKHMGQWASKPKKSILMPGISVNSVDDGATWSYETPQDWPAIENVSFFACAPVGSGATVSVTDTTSLGIPKISYTVPANPSNQKDLLIASPQYNWFRTLVPVNILFNHALSMIRFTALNTGTGNVTIKKIAFNNIYNSGTVPLEAPVKWSVNTVSSADYVLDSSNGLMTNLTLELTPQDICSDDGLFLMPQSIIRSVDKPEIVVTLIRDGEEITFMTPVFTPEQWEPGRSYNYQIAIENMSIQLIVIDETVTLTEVTASSTTQSVSLTSDKVSDLDRIYKSIITLNSINGNEDILTGTHFGIYAANELQHDITIDMDYADALGYTSNFTGDDILVAGDQSEYIIFDFKKILKLPWGSGGDPEHRWKVEVLYDTAKWVLASSYQSGPLEVDALSGATTQNPINEMQNKGSIILKKK